MCNLYGFKRVDDKGNLQGMFLLASHVSYREAREVARAWSRRWGLPTKIIYA